ncbi:hypothetical protein L083_3827 [Actinoplanes sp. N902-109]|nr:hypothetical protein L083_3827 [Actinoplanes sp. N902-109]
MDDDLARALQPVLADLAGPGGVLPEIRDEPWTDLPDTASVMLYAADGSGQGVSVDLGLTPVARVVAVADQVQEWAIEALWSAGRPTNWPPCDRHPVAHPATAREQAGRAVWACPVTGTEVAGIGHVHEAVR